MMFSTASLETYFLHCVCKNITDIYSSIEIDYTLVIFSQPTKFFYFNEKLSLKIMSS